MLKPRDVSRSTSDQWYHEVSFILKYAKGDLLSRREKQFVQDMESKLLLGQGLSFRQSSWLRDIYKTVQEDVG